MNPAIDYGKSRFSHWESFFSDYKVIVTAPSVHSSKPELATSYVFHNESLLQLILLVAKWLDKFSHQPVHTCQLLMSTIVRAVNVFCGLEKKQLFSTWHYVTMGFSNYLCLQFLRCDCTGSHNPWESARFSPLIQHKRQKTCNQFQRNLYLSPSINLKSSWRTQETLFNAWIRPLELKHTKSPQDKNGPVELQTSFSTLWKEKWKISKF
jgi:hypothetical protein